MTTPPSTNPTTLNGRYVFERRLGAGGMAEVFLARTVGAEGFSRPVAVKRVLSGVSQHPEHGPRWAALFIEEAQLCARLQHPNIVSVLDFDRDEQGQLFLVMELVEGVDLAAFLASGPLPFSLIIHLTIEILHGLGYAHELPLGDDRVRGLIHRDVSPQNVLLSWEGAVKVSDFGIAKLRAATMASGSIGIKGKPVYMAPEQINGGPLDGRSDLFAVGVMMFEMLTGRLIFGGATAEEILAKALFAPIPDVRGERPDVPEDLAAVVSMLLAREPNHRFSTAGAAIAALSSCKDATLMGRGELISALAERFPTRAPIRARTVRRLSEAEPTIVAHTPPPIVAPTPVPKRPPQRTKTAPPTGAVPGQSAVPSVTTSARSRRWMWAALAGLLVVGTAVAAVLIGGDRQRTGTPVPTTAAPASSATAAPRPAIAPPSPAPAPASPTPGIPPTAAPAPNTAADSAKPPPAGDKTIPSSGGQGSAAPPAQPNPTPPRHPSPPRREPPPKKDDIHEIKLGT